MSRVPFVLLVACLTVAGRAADLPVRDGLALWLDASAQAGERRKESLPAIGRLQPVDFVLDSSTRRLVMTQPAAERRPLFETDGEVAYWKFDGKDDFLAGTGLGEAMAEVTIFILAAPQSNMGGFRALFSASRWGANDYTTGLNFDFGPGPTSELTVLNVESAGAGGFRDLLVPGFLNAVERPFGGFHIFTVRSKPGQEGTEVFLDGFKGGGRDRAASEIGMAQYVMGARHYSNDASQPPFAQGHFDGAIAELIVYARALSEEERRVVEQVLRTKTARLEALRRGDKGHALETVKDPPVAQMLAPGFTVRELPLQIGNLNNVRYRPDGKVVALGYDGRIHLLTDTDGDGLEDRAEFFWEERTLRGPIGMALTPPGYGLGDGVFVASKGKISLILDTNRDGRAEEERVIARGWPESFHSVDTLGVAVHPKDGSIYFGLGCANFVEAYLIDRATGRSQYSLQDIRGTIQRLSADFSKQETVCTGVRFTCALAFNEQGDLFATDQEGATWLPNGNPLDELLHIQRGKHYGFPPRHPKHLPQVRDEPAVIEFGPQHQSTVGMVFNHGVNGGLHFGPDHWRGDAIICGESRGKIWRTKLARTPLGYVAQNHLIACLSWLTVDACVSPGGDLLVVCHSGPPDWGTGPAGLGRIFKIRYTGKELPQPVQAWAAGPDEFRISFDRELDPADWANAKAAVKVEAGAYVGAGDRFEVLRPGYQVVRDQITTPRRWVEVLGLTLTEDLRTLVIRVARQTERVNYAVTLPAPERWKQAGGLRQHPQIDLLVTMNGLSASVSDANGKEIRTILPHPSLAASAILTSGSAEHERFLKAARRNSWRLAGQVDVSNPYVPAVQPGSKLDWDPSSDSFASARFGVRSDDGANEREVPVFGTGSLMELEPIEVAPERHGAGSGEHGAVNGLVLAYQDLRHTLSPARMFVPWSTEPGAKRSGLIGDRTDVKGDWLRGRRVFLGEAGCATCHTIRGEGIAFGPDLSNLIHRDRDSVVQDILRPSATINPDQAGTLLTMRDGTALSGLVRSMTDEKVTVGLAAGAVVEVSRSQIARTEPLKVSLMPEGLGDRLKESELEDLLTFLLTNPLEPAPLSRTDPPPPPPRTLKEVAAILGKPPAVSTADLGPLRILLCAGPKDHGPDEHDYPLWLARWSRLLSMAERVTVTTSMGFPSAGQLKETDVAVFCNANPSWNLQYASQLDEFHRRGGGTVYIHYAVDGGKEPGAAAERIGLAFTLGSRFRHGELDLVFSPVEHPITRGFPTLRFVDETYWNMRGEAGRLNVLGTAMEENSPRPQLWTLERFKGRVVGCIPGHYTWTFDDPLYRALVFRSICWAARESNADRLRELIFIGARVSESF